MWQVKYKDGSNWISIRNIGNSTRFHIPINETEDFTVEVAGATKNQLYKITENTEIQLSDGDETLLGFVENRKLTESGLLLEGSGYIRLLKDKLLSADNTSNETSGTGYDVIYAGVAFNIIASDILSGTGVTAGTISETSSKFVRFTRAYVFEAEKKLAELIGNDLWIDSSKQLNIVSHRGSSPVVMRFQLGINAQLVRDWFDRSRVCDKAVVRGSSSSEATYGTGSVERRFYAPELTTNSMCSERAQNMVTKFGQALHFIQFMATAKGVKTGDHVYLEGKSLDGEYRVVDYTAEFGSPTKLLTVTSASGSNAPENFPEKIMKMIKATAADNASITTGAGATELSFSHADNADPNAYYFFRFYIDPQDISDIIRAGVAITRNETLLPNGTNTGTAYSGFSQSNHGHSYTGKSENTHGHSYTGKSESAHGHSYQSKSENSHDHNVDGITTLNNSSVSGGGSGYNSYLGQYYSDSNWHSVYDFTAPSSSNCDFIIVHVNLRDTSSGANNFYCRVHDNFYGWYYPDSNGFRSQGGTSTHHTFTIPVPGIVYGDSISVELRTLVYPRNFDLDTVSWMAITRHTHGFSGGTSTAGDIGNITNISRSSDNSGVSNVYRSSEVGGITDISRTSNNANLNDNPHSNPLSIDAQEYDDGANHDIDVYVDGQFVQTISAMDVNSLQTLDISSLITTTGWHYIELRPQSGQVRLAANVSIKAFTSE